MVLASTPDTGNITELAQLADKVVEVATPSVSGITTTTELDQLRQEVAELKTMLRSLQTVNKKSQRALLKRRYEIHTKIGMIQEFTPRIPLFGMNNIPMGMHYIPSHKYVFRSYLSMLSIPFKCVIHTCKVCITFLIRYDIHLIKV